MLLKIKHVSYKTIHTEYPILCNPDISDTTRYKELKELMEDNCVITISDLTANEKYQLKNMCDRLRIWTYNTDGILHILILEI